MRGLLEGETIRLTSLKEKDYPVIEEWFNDVHFMRHYDMIPAMPQSLNQVSEGMDYYKNTNERCIFAVRMKEKDEILGVIGFNDIIWSNGTGFLFIGIGSKNDRKKGLGKEALRLILDFGFNELNLYKIQLNVLEYNQPAVNLYEKAGFVKEGTYREFIFRDGQRYDMYLYGLIRSEYRI